MTLDANAIPHRSKVGEDFPSGNRSPSFWKLPSLPTQKLNMANEKITVVFCLRDIFWNGWVFHCRPLVFWEWENFWDVTARPLERNRFKKKGWKTFQPSIVRCELLVSGRGNILLLSRVLWKSVMFSWNSIYWLGCVFVGDFCLRILPWDSSPLNSPPFGEYVSCFPSTWCKSKHMVVPLKWYPSCLTPPSGDLFLKGYTQ